jgi:hypothetical protein
MLFLMHYPTRGSMEFHNAPNFTYYSIIADPNFTGDDEEFKRLSSEQKAPIIDLVNKQQIKYIVATTPNIFLDWELQKNNFLDHRHNNGAYTLVKDFYIST